VHLLFDGVPEGLDLRDVQALLEALPGVASVHDLHVWAMGTSHIAMTAHLVMPTGMADDAFLQYATQQLHERFRIEHATLQVVRVPFTRPCIAAPGPARPLDGGHGLHGHDAAHPQSHHHGHAGGP
jgi:cobalt-zinc-cadmium efflux system protein